MVTGELMTTSTNTTTDRYRLLFLLMLCIGVGGGALAADVAVITLIAGFGVGFAICQLIDVDHIGLLNREIAYRNQVIKEQVRYAAELETVIASQDAYANKQAKTMMPSDFNGGSKIGADF